MTTNDEERPLAAVERIQTGLRMDKTLLKVLKAVAELKDMSLADLVEGLVLHALEGEAAITDQSTLEAIEKLRGIYGMQLRAANSHTNPE